MKATIWTGEVVLPAGFCYNCNAPSTTTVSVTSEGGIASSIGSGHGLVVATLAAAATSGSAHQVTYCARCADTAHKKAPDRVAGTLGIFLVLVGFSTIAFLTTGADRTVSLAVSLLALVGLIAWLWYVRRPLEPGQTTRWRAFAVLNEGRDLLNANHEFIRIEYSNPRLLDEIRRLNPGVEVTSH